MRTNVRGNFGRTNTKRTNSPNRKPTGNKQTYSKVCTNFQHKIASYRTLVNQAKMTSGNLETVHHLLATGGVEVRFGGSRTAYWPWNPGRHYW